jgi:hypothetical protein
MKVKAKESNYYSYSIFPCKIRQIINTRYVPYNEECYSTGQGVGMSLTVE